MMKYKYKKFYSQSDSYFTFKQLFLDHENVSYLPIESQIVAALVVIHITSKMHSSNVEPVKNINQSGTGQYIIQIHDFINELTCVYAIIKGKQTLKNCYIFIRNKFPYLIMFLCFIVYTLNLYIHWKNSPRNHYSPYTTKRFATALRWFASASYISLVHHICIYIISILTP